MGGHGGLNILPQKSWNVYGRENRLKVARDEAKFEEESKIKRERHIQCFLNLSQQAEHQVIDAVPATSLHVHQEATQQLSEEKQECAGTHAVQPVLPETQLCTQSNKGQMLKHINFWHEDELKMAHPEVQAEKQMERKRRGNKDTQTSDAKFDEQFKLGHQMGSQPWYSRKASSPPPPEARLPDIGQGIALTAGTDLLLTDAAVKQHSRHKHRKSRKKSRHEKESKVKSVSELRAERQVREQAERSRQDRLLQAHKGSARPR
ncbi:MAG: hypothetical protein FRX49_02162 [Trebouxia sp. A1-2]|nr:MAG: hypothetical protein FRX49_02162 [Trebouxia sp. A1-2]